MTDQKTVRLVIAILGLLALAVVVGGVILAVTDRSIPDALIAIGAGAAASVGSILAKTSGTSDPQPVNIVNVPSDPVPTTDVPAKSTSRSKP